MAKVKAASVAVVLGGIDDSYAKAEAKAQNPAMTTANNPLAEHAPVGINPQIVEHNMERLHRDAHMRRCPTHGGVYSAIMDTRYGG